MYSILSKHKQVSNPAYLFNSTSHPVIFVPNNSKLNSKSSQTDLLVGKEGQSESKFNPKKVQGVKQSQEAS